MIGLFGGFGQRSGRRTGAGGDMPAFMQTLLGRRQPQMGGQQMPMNSMGRIGRRPMPNGPQLGPPGRQGRFAMFGRGFGR